MGGYYRDGWGMGPGNGFWMFVLMALFWVLIAAAVVYFVRHSNHAHAAHHSHGPIAAPDGAPIDLLKMRFAKGEIDEEEFTKRLKLLQGDR